MSCGEEFYSKYKFKLYKNRFSYGFFTHTDLEAFSDVLAFMVVGSAVPAPVAEEQSIVLTRREP